jgi:hypothetical protein
MLRWMPDLGQPSSYLALDRGTRVYSSDGADLGEVQHVLGDAGLDLFDGFVLDTSVLPGGHRFVDASQVEEVYERGVVLTVDAATAERLPKPSANPGEVEVGPDDLVAAGGRDKLRRAWDLISGKG